MTAVCMDVVGFFWAAINFSRSFQGRAVAENGEKFLFLTIHWVIT